MKGMFINRLHFVCGAALLVAGIVCPATDLIGQVAPATQDSVLPVFRRAQQLINDGSGAEGRALIDSVLEASAPRSPAEAEALFWRATLAESWENAQRDYLRIMLEHDRSDRAGDAMLRLAQGEASRGDREAAFRYLERLVREMPNHPARGEAGLWHGRLYLERGERPQGCTILREHRPFVKEGSLELENQYDYLLRGCPEQAVAAPAPRAAAPTTQGMPTTPPSPAATGNIWSVQVAALGSAAEAEALAGRLREKGYETRVDGSTAPFRVRFGRFATRAEAVSAMERYRASERADAFLVEVPRG